MNNVWEKITTFVSDTKQKVSDKWHELLNQTDLDDKAKAFVQDKLDKTDLDEKAVAFAKDTRDKIKSSDFYASASEKLTEAKASIKGAFSSAEDGIDKSGLRNIFDTVKGKAVALKDKAVAFKDTMADRIKASEFWKSDDAPTLPSDEYQA